MHCDRRRNHHIPARRRGRHRFAWRGPFDTALCRGRWRPKVLRRRLRHRQLANGPTRHLQFWGWRSRCCRHDPLVCFLSGVVGWALYHPLRKLRKLPKPTAQSGPPSQHSPHMLCGCSAHCLHTTSPSLPPSRTSSRQRAEWPPECCLGLALRSTSIGTRTFSPRSTRHRSEGSPSGKATATAILSRSATLVGDVWLFPSECG